MSEEETNPVPDPKTDPAGYIRYMLQDTRDLVKEAFPAPVAIRSRMDCIEGALDTLVAANLEAITDEELAALHHATVERVREERFTGAAFELEKPSEATVLISVRGPARGQVRYARVPQLAAEEITRLEMKAGKLYSELADLKRKNVHDLIDHRAELREAMGTPPPSLEPIVPGTDPLTPL